MIASIYKMRKIGSGLKHRTGRYRILGIVKINYEYWIIDDLDYQVTYHVPVSSRPTWEKYSIY